MKKTLKISTFATFFLSAALATFASFGAAQEIPSNPPLPDWATAQIDETFARFQDWKGDDETFVFPIITDVHSPSPDLAVPIDWRDSKTHIYLLKATAKKFGADFIADLGDMGLDVDATKEREVAERRLATQLALYADAPVPVVFALGNHDHNNRGYYITSRVFGEMFDAATKKLGLDATTGPNLDYGYIDFTEKKTRLIYLNTSDDGYYGYSTAQLQFLVDALTTTPDGCVAFVIQHFCMYFDLGMWKSSPDAKAKRGELCMKILESFVAGTDGEEDGVRWNFSRRAAQTPARFVGVFCGDSHFDNFEKLNGVNYTITQGFGGVNPQEIPDGAIHRGFNRGETTLIDVVAVKPKKGETKIFRVGVGGAEADRIETF